LWGETRIGDVLPWKDVAVKAQRLLDIHNASRKAPHEDHEDGEKENDQDVDRDETDPYNEVIFGRKRPDSVVFDWTNKILFVLEFKRTSDNRSDYRERGEYRARAQHDILIRSLEKVAGEAVVV
jgi:alpha-L-fucosidase